MNSNKIILLLCVLAVSTSLISFTAAQETGDLEIDVLYFNGDIADHSGIEFVIYQDQNDKPFLEKDATNNPEIIPLPINHEYKIEVYSNDMFSGFEIVKLNSARKDIDIKIPLSGGLQITVLYEDKQTPVADATVSIKSQEGNEWRKGQTNDNGKTLRFWIQSTNRQDNYYVADVYLGDTLVKTSNQIRLEPGVSTDKEIVLSLPKIIDDLITVSLFKNSEKVSKKDGDYTVILQDLLGNKVESDVNFRGDAHFSLLKPAQYTIMVDSPNEEKDFWPKTDVFIQGRQNQFNIFMNAHITPDDKEINVPDGPTCKCVAFRLDDIQDFWLNEVQIKIMDQFTTNDIPITIGIISDSFGEDPLVTDYVNTNKRSKLKVASHGVGTSPFTDFDKQTQTQLIRQSINQINDSIGVTPHVFIPPQNRFDQDTIDVLIDNGFTHISGSILHGDAPPFPLTGEELYRFPEVAATGQYDPNQKLFVGVSSNQTISDAVYGINNFGFAVITMHPQEFSIVEDGVYTNDVNKKQILQLQKTINELETLGYEFVTINQINLDSVMIPEWVKNTAGWWSQEIIDDSTFANALQYLIQEGIIVVPNTEPSSQNTDIIPEWIKNSAGWWATNQITDSDFVKGIEFLIANGIIKY